MNRTVLVVLAVLIVTAIIWGTSRDGARQLAPKVEPKVPEVEQQQSSPAEPPTPQEVDRVEVSSDSTEVPPELAGAEDPSAEGVQRITGRLVTKQLEPVRDALLRTSLRRGHEYRYADLETDHDGVFVMELPPDFDGNSRLLYLRSRPTSEFESAWLEASQVLWPTYPVGLTDVGDIVATPLPLLCSGVVRSDAGLEVAAASVYALPQAIRPEHMQDERMPEMFRCETDANGVFRIYGKHEPGKYTVVARAPGMIQTEEVLVDPGATDLALVMAAGASLSGSVKLGDRLDARYVYLNLVGDAVAGYIGEAGEPLHAANRPLTEKSRRRVRVGRDGAFVVGNLRPGTISCSVHIVGRAQPVAKFDSVRIDAGRECSDGRLQGIDLSEFRLTTVQFTKADGDAAVRPMLVAVKEAEGSDWGQLRVGEDGRLLVASKEPFAVLVQQRGYRRTLVENITENTTVELQRGLEVRVKARLGTPIPDDFGVTLQLIGVGPGSGPGSTSPSVPRSEVWPILDDESLTIAVPTPGRYRAEIRVLVKGGSRAESMALSDVSPAEISVVQGLPGVEHLFELPQTEAFRATLVINQLYKRGPADRSK